MCHKHVVHARYAGALPPIPPLTRPPLPPPACPFSLRPLPAQPSRTDCTEVKSLFKRLGVDAKVVELDDLADGAAVQDAVTALTGKRTVPQVGGWPGWGRGAGSGLVCQQ